MSSNAATLLRELARQHVRAQRAALACHGTSVTQCTVLTELGRTESMTVAELSRRLQVDKGWISRAIDRLVTEGLVRKVQGAKDRRTVTLTLTAAGKARYRKVEKTLNDHVAGVIARIPRAERAAVERALKLLHASYLAAESSL